VSADRGGAVNLALFLAIAVAVAVAGCSTGSGIGDGEATTSVAATAEQARAPASGCADVVDATLEPTGERVYRVSATVRSSDTGDEKYADAWEVWEPDGSVLATRVLTHPHVGEQPFTRSLDGVEIPEGTDRVEIAAQDSVLGFCGATVTVVVPAG